MDIGTAKPSPGELASVRFHMVDIAEPADEYTLADFQTQASAAINEIRSRGHLPILCGGTGLYFRSITTRLDIPHTPPDDEFRARWAEAGLEATRERLLEVDPVAAEKIHPGDMRRMARALEVFEKTGTMLSEWHRRNREASAEDEKDMALFCLNRERSSLYHVIEQRVDAMMDAGFFEEVQNLREIGVSQALKPMQALGYRQLNAVIDGDSDINTATESIKAETRQFARRQLIWYRADKRLQWLDSENRAVEEIARHIYSNIKIK